MACIYVAFVEGFRLNADFWTSTTLDNIIKVAEKIIQTCVQLNYKSENNDFDIIQQITARKAELDIKLHFAGPLSDEPNIFKALSVYFSKFNTCVLCSKNLYLLIWKRCKNLFYVYDPNGRAENCTRDFENGKSALLSTNFVEHLVHFVMNISRMKLNDEFKLYEIFLTSYGKIYSDLPDKPFPKALHKKWAVVNGSYAVIPGCNNGISQPVTSHADNPSMLISVMAILYSHIENASTWKPGQVDELIRLGTAYYKSLRRLLQLNPPEHVTIIDLPDKYVLGTFKASIRRVPFMYTGAVTDFCKKYTDSLLTSGMLELFANNGEAALLQVDNSVLGIWRDDNFFYVYDPFRRGKAGQVLDPDDYRTQGNAIMQIHSNIDSLLSKLYESSVKMRRGAKFFIHAIKVGCIKPILDGKPRKLRYPKLNLTPETYEHVNNGERRSDPSENSGKRKKEQKPRKSDNLPKICSIETLSESDRIVVIRTVDLVEPMAEDLVCDIITKLPDCIFDRPKLYKTAERVLLQSDKEYLECLKYMLQHDEDIDNMEMAARTGKDEKEPMISVEEELQIPTNFNSLPDGTWIVFGSQTKHHKDEAQMKLVGLLSSIVTAALTTKYKISTWTPQLVDYAWESAGNFGDSFSTYHYALGTLLHKRIPKLQLGDRTYQINIKRVITSDNEKPLKEVLMGLLLNFNRLLVICQRFCCLLVKRFNFIYMFCGFPVNEVGYRNLSTGCGCMMRFLELDPMIRRIELGGISNYVVVPLKVWDITAEPHGRYVSVPKNIEDEMYNEAWDINVKAEDSKMSKIEFLNKELEKENLRIKNFKAARETVSTSTQGQSTSASAMEEIGTGDNDGEFNGEEDDLEEECAVRTKHNYDPETDTLKGEPILKPQPVAYGYRLREKDLLFKIQGSQALDGRKNCVQGKVKPCLFASTLAILYATLKPLNEWTSYRIDQVIDSTSLLTTKIENMSNTPERIVKNISVDDYNFNVLIKHYNPPTSNKKDIEKQFDRIFVHKKYLLLMTANCTYAIVRDDYYHLFDPYSSMALMTDQRKEDKQDKQTKEIELKNLKQRRKSLKSTKLFGERNTASWILFFDTATMLEYLNKRSCSKTWIENQQYTFLVLEIISFKKAPQSSLILQMLTDMQSSHKLDDRKPDICAQNETIAWLDARMPIWSRLNRKNAVGRYRDMAVTKLNKYDIEVDERLWSLWGTLHPQAAVFDTLTRGKQYLACCIICLCAASNYRLIDWSPNYLDSIVVSGDRYFYQSLQTIKCNDYQLSLEDLNVTCELDKIKFQVHIEMAAYGKLYSRPYYSRMNLSQALMYFFNTFQFGVLQCFKKCLAIGFVPGDDGGYFMFDCQSREKPLFPNGQGSAYILRTKYLQILLYCIVVTLKVPYYNMDFTLHKVTPQVMASKRSTGGRTAEEQVLKQPSEKSLN